MATAPEPTKAKQLHCTTAGRVFVVDESGNLFERVQCSHPHMPQQNRPFTWDLFPRPNGWAVDQITSGPNGILYVIAEGEMFLYERDSRVMYPGLQDANHWVPIALPDSKPPPEPERPQPTMCWNATGLAGIETFTLGEGKFILVKDHQWPVTLERKNERGDWREVVMSSVGRFVLPAGGEHEMRAKFGANATQATIYKEI